MISSLATFYWLTKCKLSWLTSAYRTHTNQAPDWLHPVALHVMLLLKLSRQRLMILYWRTHGLWASCSSLWSVVFSLFSIKTLTPSTNRSSQPSSRFRRAYQNWLETSLCHFYVRIQIDDWDHLKYGVILGLNSIRPRWYIDRWKCQITTDSSNKSWLSLATPTIIRKNTINPTPSTNC